MQKRKTTTNRTAYDFEPVDNYFIAKVTWVDDRGLVCISKNCKFDEGGKNLFEYFEVGV